LETRGANRRSTIEEKTENSPTALDSVLGSPAQEKKTFAISALERQSSPLLGVDSNLSQFNKT
jgi:hypothetical protein